MQCFLLFFTVDITVYRNGYHGDLNETFYVGEVDEGAKRLVQTTYECLMQSIDAGKGWLEPMVSCLIFSFLFYLRHATDRLLDILGAVSLWSVP